MNKNLLATDDSKKPASDMEVIEVKDFDYDGFQVVRGEFFAHIHEPSFTLSKNKVYVNTACIRKLPDIEYVQILVDPNERKLAVRPCNEEERDSIRWCSNTVKRSPKQITCRMFFAKVIDLMGWSPDHRIKLIGKLIHSRKDYLFLFDLTTPEIYKQTVAEDGKTSVSRRPSYPEEWKTQFGIPVNDHQKRLQMNVFDGNSIIRVESSETKRKTRKKQETESEGQEYEQISLSEAGIVP